VDYSISLKFCPEFKHTTKREQLKAEWRWKLRQITHFLTPVQIRGGVGEIFILIVETLPNRTSRIHLVAIHCAATERGELIKKQRKKEKFIGKT